MRNLGLGDLAFLGAVGGVAYDADAAAYIAAVELADGQALEAAVKDAIDAFVRGCKADGIWAAIKASCILAGARTLAGALVPLAGAAPTNVGFVAGDYNRKIGLKGNGSTKYLDSNRAANADPQNSTHVSVYATTSSTTPYGTWLATEVTGNFGVRIGRFNSSSTRIFTLRSGSQLTSNFVTDGLGFSGASRSGSSAFTSRGDGKTTAYAAVSTSSGYNATTYAIFTDKVNGLPDTYSGAWFDGRLAFYSIGEAVDLALLDARVTTLINALAAAIP